MRTPAPAELPDFVKEAIETRRLLAPGESVAVGVSGGADSVALLHLLHRLGYAVTAAHLHHGLRPEADEDERFVRETAGRLGVPFLSKRADVPRRAREEGISVEMAARRERLAFFREIGAQTVALAHQADDQVETFLLRLLRGAGPEGLGGMRYERRFDGLRIVRPLLDVPRATLRAWLESEGLPWREDASNADERILRNRVRHTLLPLLERDFNPAVRRVILRTMRILREENEWLDRLLETLPEREDAPIAERRRRLRRRLLDEAEIDELPFEALERIIEAAGKGGSRFVELPGGKRAAVEYGRVRIEETSALPSAPPRWRLTREEGFGIRRDHGKGPGVLPAEASFSAERMGDAAPRVRPVRPGDRFAPLGMDGTRKLQDILTDCKVPRARRSRVPVVECCGEIIWVPGYRIARGWELPDPAAPAVHLRIEPEE